MLKLILISSIIAVVWLVGLPMLAHWAPVADHISQMKKHDVNVSARFYTELNWMPDPSRAFK